MNRPTLLVPILPVILFVLPACQQEIKKKPDHVLQQEQRKKQKEAEAKKRKVAKAKEKTTAKKEDDEDNSWPGPVRLAFYKLYTAQITEWPDASRRLALLGLPAVPAIKRLLINKRQPNKKKALVSLLYVQMHMFRPQALTMMARDESMPFVRRGAIEALARIGNVETRKALKAVRHELENARPPKVKKKTHSQDDGHGHGHGSAGPPTADELKRPFGPIIDFIVHAEKNIPALGFSASQLAVLDSVFHAESGMKLKVALDWITDDSLELGLLEILRSPVTRPQIHMAVIKRMVASATPKKFRDYCEPGYPQMLRMLAAKKLLDLKQPADRKFLQKLAGNSRDPISSFLNTILSGKQPAFIPQKVR